MKILVSLIFVLAIVAITTGGCSQKASEASIVKEKQESLYFVRGYRSDDDPCKLTGETGFTNQFLDDSANLVSCPETYGGLANFVTLTGAVVVAEKDGYILFRVPKS